MSLRAINDSNDALSLMQTMIYCLVPNTLIAQMSTQSDFSDRMYIEDRNSMIQGAFPACNLTVRNNSGKVGGGFFFTGSLKIKLRYCDRWDTQSARFADIKKSILTDLLRMVSNIEDNNTLIYQAQQHAVSVPQWEISEDFEFDETTSNIRLIYREVEFTVNKLPYYG